MIPKSKLECQYPVGNGVSSPEYAPDVTIIIPNSAENVSQDQAREIPQNTTSGENLASPNRGKAVEISALDRDYLNNQ